LWSILRVPGFFRPVDAAKRNAKLGMGLCGRGEDVRDFGYCTGREPSVGAKGMNL